MHSQKSGLDIEHRLQITVSSGSGRTITIKLLLLTWASFFQFSIGTGQDQQQIP